MGRRRRVPGTAIDIVLWEVKGLNHLIIQQPDVELPCKHTPITPMHVGSAVFARRRGQPNFPGISKTTLLLWTNGDRLEYRICCKLIYPQRIHLCMFSHWAHPLNKLTARHALFAVLIALMVGLGTGCGSSAAPPAGPPLYVVPPLSASASADIIIVEKGAPRLTRVQAIPANILLAPGETLALSALAFDQEGREIENVTITWQALDLRAGTMTPRGVFRAGFDTGTFEEAIVVTAKAPVGMGSGILQATAMVTVKEFSGELRPSSIRVFPENPDLEPGESLQLVALAVDLNGVAIPNMKFRWEMRENLAGSISQDGRLKAGESIGDFANAIEISVILETGTGQG